MMLSIDQRQAEVMGEILQSALRELRNETAHADSRDYRALLHERERVVEALLVKLGVDESRAPLG